ncbi:MAG: hypothetical protein U0Q16_36875 [Bryobacteraceae bacterium]
MTTATDLSGLRNKAFFVGLAGLVAMAAGFASNSDQFFRSYLIGYIYWLLIAVTCLGLLSLHHLVGGQWGVVIRRLLECGARTIPVNLLFGVPILLNLPKLYEWARPEHVAHDEILKAKSAWLNPGFFTIRFLIYYAIWLGVGYLMNKWSDEQENGGGETAKDKLRNLSGPGVVLHILTMTFAAFDIGMSLEPHWFSTMYGVIYLFGGCLSTMAFLVIVLRSLQQSEPMGSLLKPNHFHDLGTLMFAFVVLWAYVSFSQYLIIWSGNLPEETPWYFKRSQGAWGSMVPLLMIFHFVLPFFLLLMRFNKKKSSILVKIAVFMLIIRLMELMWLIGPAFHEVEEAQHHFIHWMDVAAPLALGGIWVGFFFYQLGRRSLVPVEVARLQGGHH